MKFSIVTSLMFIICATIGAYFTIINHREEKYTLPGEITKCTSHKIPVYQYSSPKGEIEYFKDDYTEISCSFENGEPSASCKSFYNSLEGCSKIYRSPKFSKDLPPIFGNGAEAAVDVVSRTKMLSIRL